MNDVEAWRLALGITQTNGGCEKCNSHHPSDDVNESGIRNCLVQQGWEVCFALLVLVHRQISAFVEIRGEIPIGMIDDSPWLVHDAPSF